METTRTTHTTSDKYSHMDDDAAWYAATAPRETTSNIPAPILATLVFVFGLLGGASLLLYVIMSVMAP